MANRLDPRNIDDAIFIYRQLLFNTPFEEFKSRPEWKKISESFTGQPNTEKLYKAISAAAIRTDRFDEVTKRLEEISRERITLSRNAIRMGEGRTAQSFGLGQVLVRNSLYGPQLKEYPDPFTGKNREGIVDSESIKKLIDFEKERISTIRRQYEPIPAGADSAETARHLALAVADAGLLYGTMNKYGLAIDMAEKNPEYITKRNELSKRIQSEHVSLLNDPVFDRYLKDYPVTADLIMGAFTGGAGLMTIPIREAIVFSMIAADDPDVKEHVRNFVTFKGGSAMDELQGAFDAAFKRIDKSIFSQEVRQRRFPVDLVAGTLFTSPAFLKTIGLPADLPTNIVWKAITKSGESLTSLAKTTNNKTVRSVINYFRDQKTVQSEQLLDHIIKNVKEVLGGGEMSDEIAGALRERIVDRVKEVSTNMSGRIDEGKKIFLSMYDTVNSYLVGMTQEEKVATWYRIQGKRAFLPADIDKLWDSPIVEQAATTISDSLERMARAENLPNVLSNYAPAYRAFAEDYYNGFINRILNREINTPDIEKLATASSTEFFKKKRQVFDVVHADISNIDNRLMDLVVRFAAPRLNELTTRLSTDARFVANVAMNEIGEIISDPMKMRVIQNALIATPSADKSALNLALKSWISSAWLTSRSIAWSARNGIEGVLSGVQYIATKLKRAEPISFSEISGRMVDVPEILNKGVTSPLSMEMAETWRARAWMEKFSDLAYRGNKFIEDFKNSRLYELALGSEKKKMAYELGVDVSALGQKSIALAQQRAVDAAKEFGLAHSFHSAFTTSTFSTLMWPFMGWYSKAFMREMNVIGQVPEFYKVAAFALHKQREANLEHGNFRQESVKIFGKDFNFYNIFPSYPIVRMLESSYFGVPKQGNKEARLEEMADKIRLIQDPRLRKEIYDSNPDLADFEISQVGRSMGSFFNSLSEMQVIPFGPGPNLLAKFLGLNRDRTPYILPGGKELTQALQSVPMEKIPGLETLKNWMTSQGMRGIDRLTDTKGRYFDPEGFLIPAVKAYNENVFDSDLLIHKLEMIRTGEYQKAFDSVGPEKAEKLVEDQVRVQRFKDIFVNRFLGFSKDISPGEKELHNRWVELIKMPELFVPTDQEIEKIQKETGITRLDIADLVWRESYMRTLNKDKELREAQQEFREKVPGLSVYSQAMQMRNPKNLNSAIDDVMNRTQKMFRLPTRMQPEYLKHDRVLQAFIKSYDGKLNVDKDGNGIFEISFSANDTLGPRLWNLAQKTDSELMDIYRNGGPDVGLMEIAWPHKFNQLKMMVPETGSSIKNKKIFGSDDTSTGIRLLPEPLEESNRGDALTSFFKAASIFSPQNLSMFPINAMIYSMESIDPKKIEELKISGKEAWDKASKILVGERAPDGTLIKPGVIDRLLNIGSSDVYGATPDTIRNYGEIIANPQTPEERAMVDGFERSISKLKPYARNGFQSQDDFNKAIAVARQEGLFEGDKESLWKSHPTYFSWYSSLVGTSGSASSSFFAKDLRGLAVNDSLSLEYLGYKADVLNALRQGSVDANGFAEIKKRGMQKENQGMTFWDALKFSSPDVADEIDYRVAGNTFALGKWSLPNFSGDEEMKTAYKKYFFKKPGQSRMEYESFLREDFKDRTKIPDPIYGRIVNFAAGTDMDVRGALLNIRDGLGGNIPLDQQSQRKIFAFKDEMPYIEDDVQALQQRLAEDPDLTSNILHYDPRLYRTIQSKVFSPYDNNWKSYVQGSQYSTEAVDFFRNLAPQAYARLYWKDPNFRIQMDNRGYPQPAPSAEVSVSRAYIKDGVERVDHIPDVLTPPEPIAPNLVPRGTFSSLPALLNYTALDASNQVARIDQKQRFLKLNGEDLPKGDQEYLKMSPAQRIFTRFPAVIAQGFREGQLGPDDVIQQLDGVARFGLTTGALPQDKFDAFNKFLTDSSNILGATRFGFEIGRFLDSAFNLPQVQINNKYMAFLLAGRPLTAPPIDPNMALSLRGVQDVRASYQASLPSFQPPPPAATPKQSGLDNAAAGSGAIAATTAAAAPATGPAAPVVLTVAAVFAVISAGFSIANTIRSGSQRKKLAEQARRQQEEQQRQIAIARAEAEAERAAGSNRRIAQERFALIQNENAARERDFNQRLQNILSEGVSFASIGQQPKEFIARFVNQFEPQVLEFTRRPQLDSRVGLIAQIQSRLPRARY